MKSIHFVGIKGVGMTPLAIIAQEAGFSVTGSDVAGHFITDESLQKTGIVVMEGFEGSRVQGVDLVIATGAHGGGDNVEVKAAKERGIMVWMQGQAAGEFMKGTLFGRSLVGISISGCHGKTTTAAMIATIFQIAGKDPSYIVGTSDMKPLGVSGHYGKGDCFIAEADEYATDIVYDRTPKFLWQHPLYGLITNIELDHPDLYPNITQMIEAYSLFINNIQKTGTLIVNGDDKNIQSILEKYNGRIISFGFNDTNIFRIEDIRVNEGKTRFVVRDEKQTPLMFELSVLGKHNVLNAVAALIVAKEAGIELSMIHKGLAVFGGTKRRLEFKGNILSGAFLYDDYAHHPTEVQASLKALKDGYPDKKIVCIFQPHTYSRTKLLFEEFSSSFILADEVILNTIFASAREPYDASITSLQLADAIGHNQNGVLFLPGVKDVVQYIGQKQYGDDTILVTMGAGNVYEIGDSLLGRQP